MTTIKDLERIQGNIALIAIIGLVLGIVSLLICFYLVFQVDNFSQGTWMKGCDYAEQYFGVDKWEIIEPCRMGVCKERINPEWLENCCYCEQEICYCINDFNKTAWVIDEEFKIFGNILVGKCATTEKFIWDCPEPECEKHCPLPDVWVSKE